MPDAAGTENSSSRSGAGKGSSPGRLAGKPGFERVFRSGSRFRGSVLKIVSLGNTLGITRLGFSVSGKTGCSVERNLFRRRVRESLRQRHVLPEGLDIVVYPAVKLSETTRISIEEDLAAFITYLSLRR